jgi:tetratricopeptide (TPR) repeat protein
MSRFLARAFTVFLVGAQTILAAGPWIKLGTPHFTLYTTAGEKKGREAILYFEQVRNFFMQASQLKNAHELPVRIVAFRSEDEYRPFRINDFATAFYSRDANRDYIVMDEITPDHYPVAVHEFTHLVVERSGLRLPTWFNEGWAEVNSTIKPRGKETAVGYLIPGLVQELAANRWIPLAELERVDHRSPLYNERDKAGLFYAQSWALVHMLYLAPEYQPRFPALVQALASGKSLSEACPEVLGKSAGDVEADLHHYLERSKLRGMLFSIKLTKSEEQPVVSPVGEFETSLVLADLMAVSHKRDEAKAAYERLAVESPASPEIEESLGYLALQAHDLADARLHFEKALNDGSTDAQMFFRLGMAARRNEQETRVAVQALRKALELDPEYTEARLQLAIVLLQSNDFQRSLEELGKIHQITAEMAPWYFNAAAFDYLNLGNEAEAAKNTENARKYARTPEQVRQAEALQRYLESRK